MFCREEGFESQYANYTLFLRDLLLPLRPSAWTNIIFFDKRPSYMRKMWPNHLSLDFLATYPILPESFHFGFYFHFGSRRETPEAIRRTIIVFWNVGVQWSDGIVQPCWRPLRTSNHSHIRSRLTTRIIANPYFFRETSLLVVSCRIVDLDVKKAVE